MMRGILFVHIVPILWHEAHRAKVGELRHQSAVASWVDDGPGSACGEGTGHPTGNNAKP